MSNQPTPLHPAPNAPDLDALAATLLAAKAEAEEARRKVLEAEQAIVAAVGAKDEGSFSVECDGYKVTTTQPVTRSVNREQARIVASELPADIAAAIFDWKPSLNVKLFKELERHQPQHFRLVARAVTSKPGKVSVKVADLPKGDAA